MLPSLQRAVREHDPGIALFTVAPMEELIAKSPASSRAVSALIGAFRDEGDPLSIRGPPRARSAVLAPGELKALSSRRAHSPDLTHALVGVPVRFVEDVEDRLAARGEPWIAQTRNLEEIDGRHGKFLGRIRRTANRIATANTWANAFMRGPPLGAS